jgi:uncharacterized protein YkwD
MDLTTELTETLTHYRKGGFRRTTIMRRVIAPLAACVIAVLGASLTHSSPVAAAPADCAYNPGGKGGLGSRVDRLALDQMDWEITVFNAINTYRKDNSLAALPYSRTLARPAMWASLDSYNRGESPKDHVDTRKMGIKQRVEFCSSYRGGWVAEINFWGQGSGAGLEKFTGPDAAMNFWKNSPGHNALLLSKEAKSMAVGLAYEGDDRRRAHYTVVFGDR